MAHVHGHHANHASSSRVLTWALGANGALLVVQVLGVLAFSSLALAGRRRPRRPDRRCRA